VPQARCVLHRLLSEAASVCWRLFVSCGVVAHVKRKHVFATLLVIAAVIAFRSSRCEVSLHYLGTDKDHAAWYAVTLLAPFFSR
jgi:hypothetical protein